jgi:signal peptide peptidase SppA
MFKKILISGVSLASFLLANDFTYDNLAVPADNAMSTTGAHLQNHRGFSWYMALPASGHTERNFAFGAGYNQSAWHYFYSRDSLKEGAHTILLNHGATLAGPLSIGTQSRGSYDNNKYEAALDFSLNWQPAPFLQASFSTTHLLYTANKPGSWNVGLGIRPFSRVALGWETQTLTLQNPDLSRLQHRFSMWAEPIAGLRVYGQTGFFRKKIPSEDIRVGVQVHVSPKASIGFFTSDENQAARITLAGQSRYRKHYLAPEQSIHMDFRNPITNTQNTFSLFGPGESVTIQTFWQNINWIAQATEIKTIYMDLSNFSGGLTMAQEVQRGIQQLRLAGKTVIAYLEKVEHSGYLAATAANSIYVHPAAYMGLKGFGVRVAFYKGLFDKAGIQGDFLRHGAYKSAIEPYTRDSMSVEFRENTRQIVDALWQDYLLQASNNRNIALEDLQRWFESPNLSIKDAQKAGLIDSILYRDQVTGIQPLPDQGTYRMSPKIPQGDTWQKRPVVGFVVLEGTITNGDSRSEFLGGSKFIGSKTVSRQLAWFRYQTNVQAVVIRINSPGGSALASDEIWRQIQLLREAGKKVIISVGNAAASGGYYIASAADVILAENASIIGSVGIFSGKLVTADLYKMLGIHNDIITTTPFADAESDLRPFSDDEKAAMQKYLDDFYHQFVRKVAAGRGLTWSQADSLSQGRVFTGTQAAELKLIDALGGLEDAFTHARMHVTGNRNGDVEIITANENPSFWSMQTPFSTHSLPLFKQSIPESNMLLQELLGTQIWALTPVPVFP